MRGVLRPTVTEGDIIVRSNSNAATDGSLDGLNRDITRSREITKNKETYTDIYISPAAAEEVLSGFKGIEQQTKDFAAKLTKDLSKLSLVEQQQIIQKAASRELEESVEAVLIASNVEPEQAKRIAKENPAEAKSQLYLLALANKYDTVASIPDAEVAKYVEQKNYNEGLAIVVQGPAAMEAAAKKYGIAYSSYSQEFHNDGLSQFSAFMTGWLVHRGQEVISLGSAGYRAVLETDYQKMYSDVRAGVTAVAQKAQELGLKGTIATTLEQTSKALSNTWDTIKNTPNALWNALAKIPAQVKEDVYGSDGGHDPTNLENSFAFGQTPTGSLMGDIVAGTLAKAFSTGRKAVESAGGMQSPHGLPKNEGTKPGLQGTAVANAGKISQKKPQWGVDISLHEKDIAKGVLESGFYKKNPTATHINELLTTSKNTLHRAGQRMNGDYMYVIDTKGNLILGDRAKSYMPHPTLIGGKDPQVLGAGMVRVERGRIVEVNNQSGHFKPGVGSLDAAKEAFNQISKDYFSKDFKGFKTYGE